MQGERLVSSLPKCCFADLGDIFVVYKSVRTGHFSTMLIERGDQSVSHLAYK